MTETTPEARITVDELRDMFGESIPIAAAAILQTASSPGEARAQLAALSPPAISKAVEAEREGGSPAEDLLDAKAICERIRDESTHTDLASDDYRRGFHAGANGCVIALLLMINDRTRTSISEVVG